MLHNCFTYAGKYRYRGVAIDHIMSAALKNDIKWQFYSEGNILDEIMPLRINLRTFFRTTKGLCRSSTVNHPLRRPCFV